MKGSVTRNVWVVAVVAFAAALLSNSLSIGQEGKEKKIKGRLPNYYADLVSPEQRERIYAVQERYARQIDELNEQLAALINQRDAEIESVLTADQREKVKKARDEATAKKKKSADDKKAAKEGKG
jgi:hypothetical protein